MESNENTVGYISADNNLTKLYKKVIMSRSRVTN